ncbi:HpcH/HpaI aldolase/citrate lyase family protein [Microbacterium elymi]|uniref:Aldolase/citrate lyase family protein n=1 Tax=Microbacterium elymi TaxID=2909587 RepID=A0ABY5NHI2_9MICO|nr:aldolase/citrate lyase family protein [Microbacterium elymi]UUT34622.1 aldolase/citrate lyase family protein [Microbacterium elymi]
MPTSSSSIWRTPSPPARRPQARVAACAWAADHDPADGVTIQIRVNAGDIDDLRAVSALPPSVGLRLPKVEDVATVQTAAEIAPGRPIAALLESAGAVLSAVAIATHPAVTEIALGESDLRSELGGGQPVIDHARLTAVYAARAAGLVPPMLSAYPAIADLDGLVADTRRGAAQGLVGRMAVHPSQIAPIAAVFRPSDADLAWARDVVAAMGGGGGVRRLPDGQMIDAAMLGRARTLLDRAAG